MTLPESTASVGVVELQRPRPGGRQPTPVAAQRPSRARLALDPVIVAGLMVLAALIRLPTIHRAFWVDEGISVGIASHRLAQIPGLLRLDGSPPLFYGLLHFWIRAFGSTPVSTHTMSLVTSLAIVPVAWWCGGTLFGRNAARAAALLAATNPFLNWYATETRMYPLVCCLGMVAVTFSVRAVRRNRVSDAVAAVVAMTALLYTHNWSLYLFVVLAAVLTVRAIARGDARQAVGVVVASGAVCLAYLPWLPTFLGQAHHTAAPWAVRPSVGDFFVDPTSALGGTMGIVVVPLLALALLAMWLLSTVEDRQTASLVAGVGALTIVAGWVAAQIEPSWTSRYLAVPLGPLLIGVAGALAGSWLGRRVIGVVAVTLVAWSIIGSLLPDANATYSKSNVAAVAAAARPFVNPGDMVIVTQTEQTAALAYYLPAGLRFFTPTGPVADPRVVDWPRPRRAPRGRRSVPHPGATTRCRPPRRTDPRGQSLSPPGRVRDAVGPDRQRQGGGGQRPPELTRPDPLDLLRTRDPTQALQRRDRPPLRADVRDRGLSVTAVEVAVPGIRFPTWAPKRGWWHPFVPALLAAALAVAGAVSGWKGTDLPAQLYRVALFHRQGLALWDSQWYGGHWLLNYSVSYPAVAGTIGVSATSAVSAAGAAWAFDRLVVTHFGPMARAGSLLFAIGTVQQVAIGQLPFLLGEAVGLLACCAAARRRWPLAVVLAVLTASASPLAAAFLALAALSALLASEPPSRPGLAAMMLGALLPVAAVTVLFPGTGVFPFPFGDVVFEVCVALAVWVLLPGRERTLRIGVAVYGLAIVLAFVVPSPVGGNIGRLEECFAIPLGACLLWSRRKWLFVVLALPMAWWQWGPAWGSIANHNARDASTHRDYYGPLLGFLNRGGTPGGRVEIVPTALHWEAVYVAPTVALARGWERQLDVANNPLFYGKDRLNPATYYAWLIDNGVRYVAVPDSRLDFAGAAEGRLVSGVVPGLRPVWSDAHWRVFAVVGSSGIVQGGELVSLNGGNLVVTAHDVGTMLVRVRYSPAWTLVSGSACLSPGPGDWMALDVKRPGVLDLQIKLGAPKPPAC